MTPSRAIKIECGVCRRGLGACTSKDCALHKTGTPLQRIKAHCLTCAPNHCVEACSGQISGTQAVAYNSLYGIPLVDGKAECPLFQFRYGKNPNLSRKLSETERQTLIERGREGRFRKKEMLLDRAGS